MKVLSILAISVIIKAPEMVYDFTRKKDVRVSSKNELNIQYFAWFMHNKQCINEMSVVFPPRGCVAATRAGFAPETGRCSSWPRRTCCGRRCRCPGRTCTTQPLYHVSRVGNIRAGNEPSRSLKFCNNGCLKAPTCAMLVVGAFNQEKALVETFSMI